MQEKNQAKKENAQSFFALGKSSIGTTADIASSQEEIFRKVSQHYFNYQENRMKKTLHWLRKRPAVVLAATAIIAVLIALPTLVLLSGRSTVIKNTPSNLGGEIAFIEGNVEYKSANGDWQIAQKDTLLEEGTQIRTMAGSKTIVNLDDGSSIRLNENSGVTLVNLDAEHIVINNDQGEVYARVVKADRDFEIKTGEITYQSLGTAYKTINTEEVKGVEVYHSKVNVLGVNDNGELLVEQGNRYYVVNTANADLAGKVVAVNLEEINQDDFVIWNKEQDETVEEFKSQMGVLFDLTPPALNVNSPADGSTTEASTVTVSGTTEAGAQVTVNDAAVNNNNGSFSHEVALNQGANGVKVVAKDAAGNLAVRNLTVNRKVNTPAPAATPKITLSGVRVDNGISFTWNVSGLDVGKGFKLVKNTTANPVYPGNDAQYLSDGATRSYLWKITDGKTYHFRVCQYLASGACGTYSNDITVTAPTKPEAPAGSVSSINLVHNGGKSVSWSVSGYSDMGFKLVWAEGSTPVYPGSDYNYYSEASTTSGTVDGEAGKTYKVRVCEYLGGSCGVYSNTITISL